MVNFWKKIKKPIFALAPMHDVTDPAFRGVFLKYKRPDVFFTEFVCIDGLCHPKSNKKIIDHYLRFNKKEKPIVAQIWGSDPEKFYKASKIIEKLGFDGIDINMGCPDKAVVKSGGGAGLILDPKLAVEIIKSVKRAVRIPVSVKTRLGFDKDISSKWITALCKAKPDLVTIHGRTKKELSLVPAHWDAIKKISRICHKNKVLILGNGDVKDFKDGFDKAKKYNVDGIMVGRAAIGNPWFFDKKIDIKNLTLKDRFGAAIFHTKTFEKVFKDKRNFHNIRKHLKGYISDFPQARELRSLVMQAENSKEIQIILKEFLKKNDF